MCEAGGAGWKCCTVTVSAEWIRLKDDMLANGQRWYCPACGGKYKVKYGMMIEVIADDKCYYWKAAFPNQTFLDIKSMMVERANPNAKTPTELIRLLLNVTPVDRDMLQPAFNMWIPNVPLESTFGYSPEVFADMEPWDWMDMLRLGRAV